MTARFVHTARLGLALATVTLPAAAVERPVASTAELAAAIGQANPGDVITLQAGTYPIAAKISVSRSGWPSKSPTAAFG